MAYRIIASNVMVLPQDEQYIVHYDKVENLLYDYWEPFEAGLCLCQEMQGLGAFGMIFKGTQGRTRGTLESALLEKLHDFVQLGRQAVGVIQI